MTALLPRRGLAQILALIVILAVDRVVSPQFFDLRLQDGRLFGSLIDVLNRGTPVALLSLGMVLVIATRGIDLSVGAIMAISGAIAASLADSHGLPIVLAAALGAGLICGLWNGFLVAVLGMQPIVATLILMVAGRGIAQLITEGRIVTFSSPDLVWLGNGAILGLPVPVPSGKPYVFTLLSGKTTPAARRFELWDAAPARPGRPAAATLVDGLCDREGPLWGKDRKLAAWQGPVGRVLATGAPVTEKPVTDTAPGFAGMVALPQHVHGEVARIAAWYF